MQDSDIDKLVLEYCKKRGCVQARQLSLPGTSAYSDQAWVYLCSFKQTEALLRQEAGVESMALSTQRLHINNKGIVENVLYSLADSNPKQYANSFDKLATWVDNSLDLYRVSRIAKTTRCVFTLHTC